MKVIIVIIIIIAMYILIIKIIITIKMKSGCALKWKKKIKSSYVYYLPHFLFGEQNAP